MGSQSHAVHQRLLQSDIQSNMKSDIQSNKTWPKRTAIHFVSLLWLLPIITLLYFNISRHIIGPSVWCPFGKCSVADDDGDYSTERARHNDRSDHNMNGVLLFVAKALEIWFASVAGHLVYEAQKALRESNGGLPVEYSLTDLEFSDFLNLFEISKWTRPIRCVPRSPKRRRQVSKLCAFVLFAFLMTILVNLMGPATGVLIQPSIQYIDQHRYAAEQFLQMQSHVAPAFGPGFRGCNPEELENHRYACADYMQGTELDSMMSSVVSPIRKNESVSLAETQEDGVHFLVFNYSSPSKKDRGEKFTVPSRQTLRILAEDIRDIVNNSYGSDLVSQKISVDEFN